jgi:tetratricopeptide (TPR) repeat protein
MTDRVRETSEAARLARRAVELGKEDAVALSTGGFALAYVAGDLDDGAAFIDQALALNPNLASAWTVSGWVRSLLGEHETALEHFAHSMRLSPLDPFLLVAQSGIAIAHFHTGRYDEASSWAEKALREDPNYLPAIRVLAASRRLQEAQNAMARLRAIDPGLRVSDLKDLTPRRRPEDVAGYAEGLRKAGLPD